MHLVIQSPGNRVVPRELVRQIPQFVRAAPPEQGAHTGLSQGQVPDGFEQVKHNREGHGVQHQCFK